MRAAGNWAISTEISSTIVHSRTAWTKSSTASVPSSRRKQIRFKRRQIAGRVVEEHVLRARVGRVDPPCGRAGVPVVDRRIVLDAGIGAGPGGRRHLAPELLGLEGLGDLAVGAAHQLPVALLQHGLHELVADPDRVVRVLARDGEVGVAVPVGGVGRDLDPGIALAGVEDDLLDRPFGQERPGAPARTALRRAGFSRGSKRSAPS